MVKRESRKNAERGKKVNKEKKVNNYKFLIMSISIVFLIISIFLLLYNIYYLKEVMPLDMTLEVTDKAGVNTNTDALSFGKNYPGGTSIREINITNNYDYPVFVSIKLEGDIAQFVSVSENNFVLEPADKKTIRYYAKTEQNTSHGNYTGQTKVVINRVLFR